MIDTGSRIRRENMTMVGSVFDGDETSISKDMVVHYSYGRNCASID